MKARLRCERPHHDWENEPEKPDHPVSLRDSLRSSTEQGFRYTHLQLITELMHSLVWSLGAFR